jgi:hypothetical protein
MSDSYMIGPGAHETAALNARTDRKNEDAQVPAILAPASAVNRLANA